MDGVAGLAFPDTTGIGVTFDARVQTLTANLGFIFTQCIAQGLINRLRPHARADPAGAGHDELAFIQLHPAQRGYGHAFAPASGPRQQRFKRYKWRRRDLRRSVWSGLDDCRIRPPREQLFVLRNYPYKAFGRPALRRDFPDAGRGGRGLPPFRSCRACEVVADFHQHRSVRCEGGPVAAKQILVEIAVSPRMSSSAAGRNVPTLRTKIRN